MGRTHVLETSLLLHRARRDVFGFFAEPENLDTITPQLPLGVVGDLAHRLFVRSRLRRIFAHRAHRISELLEPPEGAPAPGTGGGQRP